MRANFRCVAIICALLTCLSAGADESTLLAGSPLMIAPARHRMLQLGFDMKWLKSVSLMTFRGDSKTESPQVFLWTGSDWRQVGKEEFSRGLFLLPAPATVIVIGDEKTVPAALIDAINWNCRTARLDTLDMAELVNRLNSLLGFDEDELAWLARRYGLNLDDVYERERVANPYAIRRSELPLEAELVAPAGEPEEGEAEVKVLSDQSEQL